MIHIIFLPYCSCSKSSKESSTVESFLITGDGQRGLASAGRLRGDRLTAVLAHTGVRGYTRLIKSKKT